MSHSDGNRTPNIRLTEDGIRPHEPWQRPRQALQDQGQLSVPGILQSPFRQAAYWKPEVCSP